MKAFKVPEMYRVIKGPMASRSSFGNNGLFIFPHPNKLSSVKIRVIASDEGGWEHVSVSLSNSRMPSWEEMCYVKDMFWEPEVCVVQFHPPHSQYVNVHKTCLHLWREVGKEFSTPPMHYIG
jgi:hypothetical protein